jgi:hypothetical protein
VKTRTSRRRLFAGAILGTAALYGQTADRQRASSGATERQGAGAATPPDREGLNEMIRAYQLSQIISVAAKLRIADHLENGSRSVAELASMTGTHEDSLYRVLRTLASMGIFTEGANRDFRLNPAAEYLRSGAPGSLHAMAEAVGEEWIWRPWGDLLHSVRTGETANDHVFGMNGFDWFRQHPDAARLFDEMQSEMTAGSAGAIVSAYDFSKANRIVDIGGGKGTLLSAALRASPSSKGVLFDLADVVQAARKNFEASLAGRCEFASGDFFKAVPGGGDLYLMKYILHDWSDSDAVRILSAVRKSAPQTARLVVVEDLVCAPNVPCESKQRDVNMLVRTGGRNRTEQEYRNCLAREASTPPG